MNLQSKNAVYNIAGPIILNGISFFSIPLFTRLLGPEQYGIVSVYQTWVGIFSVIVGLQVQGSIGTAMAQLNENKIREYISTVLILGLIFSFFCFVIWLLFKDNIIQYLMLENNEFIVLLLHSIAMFIVAFAGIAFVFFKQANYNFFINVILSVLNVVGSIAFIFLVYPRETAYLGRIYGMAIPAIVIGFFLVFYFLIKGRFQFNLSFVKFCLPISIPLIFHGLSHIVLAQSDRIMLQHMVGNEVTGLYSFMMIFSSILVAIWGAFNNTWVPFYYDDLRKGNIDIISKKSRNYIFIYTVMLITFLMWAPEVIKFLVPATFWSSITLLPIFVLSNYFVFLYGFPVNFQFFHKTTYTIAIGTVLAALLNIGFNFYAIPLFGAMGAAIATLIAHILLFVFHEFIAEKVLSYTYHYNFMFFVPGLLVVAVSIFGFYILQQFEIIRWIIGGILTSIFCYKIYMRKSIF